MFSFNSTIIFLIGIPCIIIFVLFLYKTIQTFQESMAISKAKKAGTYSFFIVQKLTSPQKKDNLYIRSFILETQDKKYRKEVVIHTSREYDLFQVGDYYRDYDVYEVEDRPDLVQLVAVGADPDLSNSTESMIVKLVVLAFVVAIIVFFVIVFPYRHEIFG